jgi:transcriptional regulator with XRE-family HTH domain
MNLAEYIATLRLKKGWSQRELARKTGFSSATIQKIESGATEHPGLDVITALSHALNVHPMKLILAYQGKDPDVVDTELEKELWKQAAIKAIEEM